jgi:ELWxxDGT repeat protein
MAAHAKPYEHGTHRTRWALGSVLGVIAAGLVVGAAPPVVGAPPSLASVQTLVKDINQTGTGTISNPVVVGSTAFFQADDAVHGAELWKSDGTGGGTSMVKDIYAGSGSSSAVPMLGSGGILYFAATDGTHGTELWRTDGSAAGTTMVKDINPGSGTSNPTYMVSLGGAVYFVATDGTHGTSLFTTDGTDAGTVRLTDGSTSAGPNNLSNLTVFGGRLYFSASDTTNGWELWSSDGTTAGTAIVTDIYPGVGGSFPQGLTVVGTHLFFTAGSPTAGGELWMTDGSAAGTVQVRDINPGSASSSPWYFVTDGTWLFFVANDGALQYGIWRTNGTTTERLDSYQVSNLVSNPIAYSSPYLYFATNSGLMRMAVDGTSLLQLTTSTPSSFFAVAGGLLFNGYDTAKGGEPWTSDGTVAGTKVLKDIVAGPGSSAPGSYFRFGSDVMFRASDTDHGMSLWRTDGTEAGTAFVSAFNTRAGSAPALIARDGDVMYLRATDGVHGSELWISDGTAAGTTLVKDIYPGMSGAGINGGVVFNHVLYFPATDGVHGSELWRSDGTADGTSMVSDMTAGSGSSNPANMIVFAGKLFFSVAGQYYSSDGTAAGTESIFAGYPYYPVVFNGQLWFAGSAGGGSGIWRSDGTATGTVEVSSGSFSSLTVAGSKLLMRGYDSTHGSELWATDGTTAPALVKDIYPGSSGSMTGGAFVSVGGVLYFDATDGIRPHQLWKSDGTDSGTAVVYDAGTSGGGFSVYAAGSTPLFVSYYTSSSVPYAGLYRVTSTAPGYAYIATYSGNSSVAGFVTVGDTTYFSANDTSNANGIEMYRMSAPYTAAPTMVANLNPGSANGLGYDIWAGTGAVYFAGDNGITGSELWALPFGSYWPLDTVDTGVTPSSPAGLDGALGPDGSTPELVSTHAPTAGDTGALRMDGTNYVVIPDSARLDHPTGSLEGWFNFDQLPITAGHPMNLLAKAGQFWLHATADDASLSPDDVAAGALEAKIQVGGSRFVAATNPATFHLQAGTWYHVVATFTGTDLLLYVNGNLTGSAHVSDSPVDMDVSSSPLAIGSWSSPLGADGFVGLADEIVVPPAPLSAAQIQALPQAPVAADDAYTAVGGGISVPPAGVLVNDTYVGAYSSLLRASLVTAPPADEGSVTLQPTGAFTFAPASGFYGDTTFTYRATYNTGALPQSNVATVTIHVEGVPVAHNDAYTVAQDQTLTVDGSVPGVLANDADPDGDAITAVKINDPVHGTLSEFNADGTFVYTPTAGYHGYDGFYYRAVDPGNHSSGSTFVSILVNDAPAAAPHDYTTDVDQALAVAADTGLLTGATDVNGDALTVTALTQPSHGVVSGLDAATGAFTYTPDTGYVGPDSFTYQVTDGHATSNTATVTLKVNGPPAAAGDSYSTLQNTTLTVGSASDGVLANDSDPNADGLVAEVVQEPTRGTLDLHPDGTFVYVPATNTHGPDSFTYRASDGRLHTAPMTVSITVNNPPMAGDDSYRTAKNQTLTVSSAAAGVLANDTDPNGDLLAAVLVTPPASGSLDLHADGTLSYVPATGFQGVVTFTYRATDGYCSSGLSTVTITVNQAPVVVSPSYTVNEDTALTRTASTGVLSGASDADGDTMTAHLVTGPNHGTLTLNTDGSFTYRGATNYNGPDTFSFNVSDGQATSATATATITVTPIADVTNVVYGGTGNIKISRVFTPTATVTSPTDPSIVAGRTVTFTITPNPVTGSSTGLVIGTASTNRGGVASLSVGTGTWKVGKGYTLKVTVAAITNVATSATTSVKINIGK